MQKPLGLKILFGIHIIIALYSLWQLMDLSSVVSVNGASPDPIRIELLLALVINVCAIVGIMNANIWGWRASIGFFAISLLLNILGWIITSFDTVLDSYIPRFEDNMEVLFGAICAINVLYLFASENIQNYFQKRNVKAK